MDQQIKKLKRKGWLRFIVGLGMLLGLAFVLTKAGKLPGATGEVIRHNQSLRIDATPHFYTEVEDSLDVSYSDLFIE